MNKSALTKILLIQDYDDSDEMQVETPWAEALGNDRYRLKNSPFMKYGVSYNDVVEAIPQQDEERPVFVRVLEKSGHKTVRVIFEESIETSEKSRGILAELANMECGYEGNGATYFAVNIQPHCDFTQVCNYLTENDIQWEFAEPIRLRPAYRFRRKQHWACWYRQAF